ncbi:MAG: hypothetical protein ACJ72H_21055 [Candidatus Sulfotelmatobacter sp.]
MINSRIAQLSTAIVFLLCLADSGWSQTGHDTSISGHVLYEDGSPVAGAEVEWHSFNPVGGIVAAPVHTDKKRAYRIDNPMVGRGVLSASKVSEGFPNAALRIYGKFGDTGYSSIKELDLKPGVGLHDQDLRFGAPDAVLTLRVVDEKSSRPIKAQVAIGLPDHPSPMLTDTITEGAVFEFVIPKHAITLRVSAPGYSDWAYRDKSTGRNALSAPPGGP